MSLMEHELLHELRHLLTCGDNTVVPAMVYL